MKRYLLIITFILLYSLIARAETIEVEASGKTSSFTYSKSKARKSALYNAFVSAFKKIMIPLLPRESIIEANEKLLEKNVYTKFNQFIEKYAVSNQKEEKGSFEVSVKVSIKKDALEKELRRLGLSLRANEKPKFIIIHEFRNTEEIITPLSTHFEKGGFSVTTKASKLEADFILQIDLQGEEYTLNILTTKGSLKLQSFAYRYSMKKNSIEDRMYADAIETALPYWTQNLESTIESITVSLVYFQTYQEIESFKTLLRSINGVENVEERSVIKVGKDKKIRFSCATKLNPNALIREIHEGTMSLKLVAFEGNDISFKIKRD